MAQQDMAPTLARMLGVVLPGDTGRPGVAYWFKTIAASAQAALLADYEQVNYDEALAKPNEKRYALHCLFNF